MNKPPRYVLNFEAARPSFWTPEIYQVVVGRANKDYANSFWLGTFWNAITVPARILTEFVIPLFNFQFTRAAMSVVLIPVTVCSMFVYGLFGRVSGVRITLEQAKDCVVLSYADATAAIECGIDGTVLDMQTIVIPGIDIRQQTTME